MPDKKFTVVFKSGDLQTVYAATVDPDDGESRQLFFRDENGEIIATFEKSALAEWREG